MQYKIYTDGSKSELGVGAGIAISVQSKMAHQLGFIFYKRCSKNGAEQLAITKALEEIEKSHINENIPRIITVHTDSRITLQSVKNTKKNHSYFKQDLRKK